MKHPPRVVLAVLLATMPSQIVVAQTLPGASRTGVHTSRSTDRAPIAPRKARSIRHRLRTTIDPVELDDTPARQAFEWWSRITGISLVVNWRAMDNAGIDSEPPVTLRLRRVPANRVLALILRQLEVDQKLIFQTTEWFVQILTLEEANRQTEVRVYDVGDLLHLAPHFTNAPRFDLQSALTNTNSGGGGSSGGGSSRSINAFATDDQDHKEQKTRRERIDDLLRLIRDTTEPEIWIANGGQYASISYFKGQLIVNAPLYVHDQIGLPAVRVVRRRESTAASSRPRSSSRRRSGAGRTGFDKGRRSTGVAGVGRPTSSAVAGIEQLP